MSGHALLSGPLLEVLESLDPSAQPDAMVYCMGAVKLLCSNSDLRTELVACGAVKTIAGHLRKLSEVHMYVLYMHMYIRTLLCTCVASSWHFGYHACNFTNKDQ